MKRLVYNPRVDVYIKADDGVYDISPYVTNCTVTRKVNQVSSAQVTFRNPGFQFTENRSYDPITKKHVWGPVFHPMDPIVITMTRLRDRPIQVFTGYCDTTPYLQLFPGLAAIDASCTLKRLQYTYWDPGLPFVWEFLMNSGWQINPQFGLFNANAAQQPVGKKSDNQKLTDSNFGQLLFNVLHDIGNWPTDTIFIEKLPNDLFDMIGQLFDLFKSDSAQGEQDFQILLKQIIGTTSLGTGGPSGGGTTVSGPGVQAAASWYPTGGGVGSCGDLQKFVGSAYAELGYGGSHANDGKAMGGLPCGGGTLKVTYKGKSMTLTKHDIGFGGPGVGGKPRVIDLTEQVATKLGFISAGVDIVTIEGIPQGNTLQGQDGTPIQVGGPAHGGGGTGTPAGP